MQGRQMRKILLGVLLALSYKTYAGNYLQPVRGYHIPHLTSTIQPLSPENNFVFQALFSAVRQDRVASIQRICTTYPDLVHAFDNNGVTPLRYAVSVYSSHAVAELVKHGALLYEKHVAQYPLIADFALAYSSPSVMRCFLPVHLNENNFAQLVSFLRNAALHKRTSMVNLLLSYINNQQHPGSVEYRRARTINSLDAYGTTVLDRAYSIPDNHNVIVALRGAGAHTAAELENGGPVVNRQTRSI